MFHTVFLCTALVVYRIALALLFKSNQHNKHTHWKEENKTNERSTHADTQTERERKKRSVCATIANKRVVAASCRGRRTDSDGWEDTSMNTIILWVRRKSDRSLRSDHVVGQEMVFLYTFPSTLRTGPS